ncbi:MAG: glycine cleavage system protein T [Bacteroidetes bacterium RIFOXYA12_FULL_35_11]|nr:MAG: glycine cleavage system protein T [Bacteroidetes bacterium GWF2_35_48]OFY82919.1 MAG: glycine cleavage system protein T [Bacteroidetes bacterium RIFOXYA12_FULL_35_11]OFY95981.1 MAG: glycine cleavage system protein T [Bacteroidetes bacterium RIFOXYB2_FULL_35_7]OFZ01873.1 MAG: glycine cleavage system protein T [Bacteroidetes bacterium RIFOXYC12_FULL_35_7]HBX52769.1 glycine cleavage system aminomethyltransferase GcvT [Bacteroidales bacterium]
MKNTAFTHIHEKLGAKMSPFAGYYMPIKYTGDIEEHVTVRTKIGVFDVSHMGEFWVKGSKALDFIQKVTSNDASVLVDGKVQYSCFPNGKGGIVDDLLVYRINAETYLLVVNAANIDKDWAWCNQQNDVGAALYNASDEISQLAVQGPLALKAMQKLTPTPVTDMEYYTFKKLDFAGVKDVIFSTTGYTGAGGCEIYFTNKDAEHIWNAVFEAGAEFGIKPIGLAARDTLRLEMGFCLYGNDIDDTTSGIEAGLGWITKFVPHKNFIDKNLWLNQKEQGTSRRLVGFEMIDRGIPRHEYEIVNEAGNKIGIVTSGTMSPMMKIGIGMGYVPAALSKPGTEILIKIRDKALKAKVVKFPFYKG